MASRSVEIIVGLFVALGLAALFVLAMKVSNLSALQQGGGYELTAYFSNVGGLKVRSAVSASGVTVGRVVDISYDDRTYNAKVTLEIRDRYDQFPIDTSASIYTSGLLGEQYISLAPGAESEYLKDGGQIRHTQSAVVLEQLIGQFLYSKGQGN